MLEFNHVTVVGSGVLGSQIAFQSAYTGKNVTIYVRSQKTLERTRNRIDHLTIDYKKDLNLTENQIQETLARISFEENLGNAVKNADIVIEALPEVIETKNNFYEELAKVAPEKTVFATNTSTLLPSQFADITGRPDRFIALHFANQIRLNNTAEIMKHDRTSQEVFDAVINFASEIGMVPLPIKKEQPGYILNSILVPFLSAAEQLLVNDVADAHTIDKTWMIATKSPLGPFAILDIVGIKTAYNISKNKTDEASKKVTAFLNENFIEKGKLGMETGEGFYTYPNPAYQDKDFLK